MLARSPSVPFECHQVSTLTGLEPESRHFFCPCITWGCEGIRILNSSRPFPLISFFLKEIHGPRSSKQMIYTRKIGGGEDALLPIAAKLVQLIHFKSTATFTNDLGWCSWLKNVPLEISQEMYIALDSGHNGIL